MCLETEDRKEKPGDVVEKKGRGRGKPFWACTRWPDCTLILNAKPENEAHLLELFEESKKPKPKSKDKRKAFAKKRPLKKSLK